MGSQGGCLCVRTRMARRRRRTDLDVAVHPALFVEVHEALRNTPHDDADLRQVLARELLPADCLVKTALAPLHADVEREVGDELVCAWELLTGPGTAGVVCMGEFSDNRPCGGFELGACLDLPLKASAVSVSEELESYWPANGGQRVQG